MMKRTLKSCAAALAFFAANSAVFAHSYKVGDIEVGHPWTWNTPPGAKVGSAFFTVKGGKADDKLLRASTPAAEKTEIHTHVNDNGVMRMRAISHVEIGAGKSVDLKPGSFHVMFFDLKQEFKVGQKVPLTLEFEKAGKLDVEVHIEDRATSASAKHDHVGGGHKH